MHLNAFHKGGSINIVISDDGKGLDRDKLLEKARSKGLVDPNATLTDEQIDAVAVYFATLPVEPREARLP